MKGVNVVDNRFYIVSLGDTLYGIAKKFNTSVQKIKELNNLTTDFINVGDRLIIMENVDNENNVSPSFCLVYTVEKGDNLYDLAIKYDTTVDEIKRYNNLTSDSLSIGQKITIPCGDQDSGVDTLPNYVTYTVKKGDTLYSIAKEFNTTVDKIKKDNNLQSDSLTVGSTLILNNNGNYGEGVVEECYGEEYTPELYDTYIVQNGDNLYGIARKFNTTVDEIKRINGLSDNNLSIGQELKIPSSSSGASTNNYKVQRGDSLYSIAKKFNTTVDELKRLNNLSSNSLAIGDVLKIPTSSMGSSTTSYKVQSGESLYSIAKKFNTTVDEIKRKNGLTSNLLSIGQELII